MEASGLPPQAPPQAPPAAAPTTDDLLRQIIAEQAAHREEVSALRDQINAQRQPVQQEVQTPLSPEEAFAARMADVSQHDYYCPGCGSLYDYRQRCSGSPERPHPPIEVVSTDELKAGDPSKHTAPVYV